MPDLDELLDADARAWRSDIDRRVRVFIQPSPTHRLRATVWSVASVAAIAVTVFAIAYAINHPAREGGGYGRPTRGANASCVAPQLVVTPRVVARGGTVTVHGEWFADGCNDTGGTRPLPITDIRLILIDAARTRQLLTAHPSGDHYAFDVTVRIPADARQGIAVITDSQRVSTNPLTRNHIRVTG